jgi:WD40 repeat protein
MTSSLDHSLRVWNVESGTQIGEDWRDEGAGLNTIALSPDGKRVVIGSGDGAVRLWDIDTAEVIATWTGHTASVNSLCWNGDRRRVVSCAYDDGTVRVWNVETGETNLGPLKFGNVPASEVEKGLVEAMGRAVWVWGSLCQIHGRCCGR